LVTAVFEITDSSPSSKFNLAIIAQFIFIIHLHGIVLTIATANGSLLQWQSFNAIVNIIGLGVDIIGVFIIAVIQI